MVEHRFARLRTIVFQPFYAKSDDRTVPACLFKLIAEFRNFSAIVHFGHIFGQISAFQPMYLGKVGCHCTHDLQRLLHRKYRLWAGGAGKRRHDEARPNPICLFQLGDHFRRSNTSGLGRANNRSFSVVAKGAVLDKF